MNIDLEETQNMIEWLKISLFLNMISKSTSQRKLKRGEIYKCDLGCGIGSEMRKKRPVVIVQNDVGNKLSGNTIIVPLTHNNHKIPCSVSITPQVDSTGKIILDGYANASNLTCISKARLGDFICRLSEKDMKLIDEAILHAVGLMPLYSKLNKTLYDKISYIQRLKAERNEAQDELENLKKIIQDSKK